MSTPIIVDIVDTDLIIEVTAVGPEGPASSLFLDDDSNLRMGRSTWGVTAAGVPYFDAFGVPDSDKAILTWQLGVLDLPVLVRIGA